MTTLFSSVNYASKMAAGANMATSDALPKLLSNSSKIIGGSMRTIPVYSTLVCL